MKNILRYIVHRTYRPFLQWHLSSSRKYRYRNREFVIRPGVFHPGFFHSTTFLLDYLLENVDLKGKRFLDLGCGSGLIGIVAASEGAVVTATDIQQKAIQNTKFNAQHNNIPIQVIKSDLFESIQDIYFDIIAVNPPYYRGKVSKEEDHAWYCGDSMEYFQRLFHTLPSYIGEGSEVFMVLSDNCELDAIREIAREKQLAVHFISEKRLLLEQNYICKIEKNSQ